MALAFALALFPLLLVLGLAFMTLSGTDYGFSGTSAIRMRAFYLADAGARYAYSERTRWRTVYTETFSLSTGDVRVHIEPRPDGTTLINSWGRSGWSTQQIDMVVETLPPKSGQLRIYNAHGGVW